MGSTGLSSSLDRGLSFHKDTSTSRPIELTEEHPLPCPEDQRSLIHQQGLRGSDERCLHMGIGIPLGVVEVEIMRDFMTQEPDHIRGDSWICTLVDRDGARRVGAVNDGKTILDPGSPDRFVHESSDIDKLRAFGRLDFELLVAAQWYLREAS